METKWQLYVISFSVYHIKQDQRFACSNMSQKFSAFTYFLIWLVSKNMFFKLLDSG